MFVVGVKSAPCLEASPHAVPGAPKHAWDPLSKEDAARVIEHLARNYFLLPETKLFVLRCRRCLSCRITSNGPGRRRTYPAHFDMVVRIGEDRGASANTDAANRDGV